MIFADSHAHVDFPDFDPDREAMLARARAAGVGYINLIATRLHDAPRLLELAAPHPHMGVVVGIHPHNADEGDPSAPEILAACDHPRVVGVGETGLDYFYDNSDRQRQQRVFRRHVQAALAANLPLVVHTREAEADSRMILEEEGASHVGGVLHCFTGSAEMAWWAVERGFHISFSGILTFRNAVPLRELAATLPLERLLIETDSPYLAPVPHRGKRNEPAFVVQVAETIALARGISLEEVAEATTRNFLRLFRLPAGVGQGAGAPGRSDAQGTVLAYPIGEALYLNVTRGCTLKCTFCPKWTAPVVHEYDLTLDHNPSAAELIAAMGDITPYREVVFCGYGEPTLRLNVVLEVAAEVKRRGKRVRINTDGLANLVYRQDVTPRMAGLVDALSISLNAQDQATYDRHCRPALAGSYQAVKAFAVAAKAHVPEVTVTALDGLEGVDVDACRRIAEEELGVRFRKRTYGRVG